VTAKKGEKIMHQLSSLIVELETARRKLQNVFEVQNGTATSEEKTRRILMNRKSIGSFLRPRSRVGHSSIKPIGFFPVTVDPIALHSTDFVDGK
jgi:hypothetical protein